MDKAITAPKAKSKKRKAKDQSFKYFLLVAPFLVLVFIFSYLPLYGWSYAFFDYRPPLKLSQCEFVGWKWFKYLFGNPMQIKQLINVLKNTFAMSGLGILTSVLPLAFAVFLNEIKCKWFKKLVQTLTTIPNFISWILVYSVAFSLFSSSGMVNHVLQDLGITTDAIKFLESDSHTWITMMLWGLWKGLGWGAIMYLAALAGADQEQYEAARVDGAGRFKLMWHITVPQLLPTYFVLLMMSIANFLSNGMEQYFIFSNSFNMQHIQVLDLYIYKISMGSASFSLGTALSMMKSIISVTLLWVVNTLSKVFRGESII
ncbi:ABC transporter permease [Anaeromicropila herbilytica]|uniref:Sugar ABC transporter permease n=1 Tax=Anaeromicropila herbilytica TaxID=2785025 RepID=A0A7R7ICY5_9FIRM|nr:ABC transporter permease subunit [Anaeromicropila herbilytica]BCN31233.1 sugar ABC transporter permease [Anaeromicropila herbilytica]